MRKKNQTESPIQLCVSIKGEDAYVYVNGANIATKKRARSQYALLDILTDHFYHSYVRNRRGNDYLSIQQLISMMESEHGIEIGQDLQIRRPLRRVGEKVSERLFIPENLFIEMLPWHGYRFNPNYVRLG